MFKKYLLLSCAVAMLSACGGGKDLDYGEVIISTPTPTPAPPNFTPDWDFETEDQVDSWELETNYDYVMPDPDLVPGPLYMHPAERILTIVPSWPEPPCAVNEPGAPCDAWDQLTVIGTLDKDPVNLQSGDIYFSVYYPDENIGNPFDDSNDFAHHLGTQYIIEDVEGRRALLDVGSGGNWQNSFDLGTSNYLVEAEELPNGFWYHMHIDLGPEPSFTPVDDAVDADFDITQVAGFGLRWNFALERPAKIPDSEFWDGDMPPQQYLYLNDVAVLPFQGDGPLPTPEPPAPGQPPEFELPVYLDAVETGFTAYNGWGGSYNFASTEFRKSGTAAISADYTEAYGALQIGVSDQDAGIDISGNKTFHLSTWVSVGTPDSTLQIQLCGTDGVGCGDTDGVNVVAIEGQWTEFALNLSDFPDIDVLKEIRIKNLSEDAKTIHIDEIGFDLIEGNLVQFNLPAFREAVEEGFIAYDGWDGTYTFNSVTETESGDYAISAQYDQQYGAMQIGASDLDISAQATLHFSIYGGEGSNDMELQVQMCGTDAIGCGDVDGIVVTIVEGEWTQYTYPVSDFIEIDVLKEIRFKNLTDVATTIYLDNVGFDVEPLPIFSAPVFYEALYDDYTAFDGWGGTYDFASTDQAFSGETSIKAEYAGGYGAMQIGASADISAYTTFHVSVYVPEGTPESPLLMQLCNGGNGCEDNDGATVTAVEGWNTFSLNIMNDFPAFTDPAALSEIRIKNYTDVDPDKTLYFDNIGFDKAPPPVYDAPVFYDALVGGYQQFDGWDGTYTFNSSEMVHHGYRSIKAEYTAGYGTMQIGGGDADLSSYSSMGLAIYMPAGQVETQIQIQLCGTDQAGCGNNDGPEVTLLPGQWNVFSFDLMTDFDMFNYTSDVLKEIRFKNYSADGGKVIYIDSIGFNE